MPSLPPHAGRRLASALALAGKRALRAAGRYIALRIISHKPIQK